MNIDSDLNKQIVSLFQDHQSKISSDFAAINETVEENISEWSRQNGGGGKTIILSGDKIEKAAINFSIIHDNIIPSFSQAKALDLKKGDEFIKNGDFDKAKDSYLDARKLAKQLASFYSDLNSSFKAIDARIPKEMQRKGKQILQILAESNERLASMYIKTEKPEVAVPLLVETIRIMSPNSREGKEAYERLIQLGFVETKYKG